MAPDMQGIVREVSTSALQSEGLANVLQGGGGGSDGGAMGKSGSNGGGLSGMKALAAGPGAAALAAVALRNAGKLARSLSVDHYVDDVVKAPGEALEGAVSSVGDRLTSSVKDNAKGAIDDPPGAADATRLYPEDVDGNEVPRHIGLLLIRLTKEVTRLAIRNATGNVYRLNEDGAVEHDR